MRLKRIAAVFAIFLCASAAWMILGGTIVTRTYSSNNALRGRVASTWGAPQIQSPPSGSAEIARKKEVEVVEEGKKVVKTIDVTEVQHLPLTRTRAEVDLDLDHRQKGLLWYSTYRVRFRGSYLLRNTTESDDIRFTLPFPAAQAIYDDLVFRVNGIPVETRSQQAAATGRARVPRGQTALLEVGYRSQGLESWRYSLGVEVAQVSDFVLSMRTDFKEIDFPENTLSPINKRRTPGGWELVWSYRNLVTGYPIAMQMPEKLQPGPLAGRISFFAPVSLFFFFFVMLLITTLRRIELHPMNYFFLAAAFFAFHLLLAYLVDHICIHTAFLISSAVSLFLVISYLRLVTGLRFAAIEAGGAQLLYLVLFSYAFFFKGFTGLTVTIGAILTLFFAMQATGRIRWSERIAEQPV